MLKSYGKVTKQQPYLQEVGSVKAILLHLNGDLSSDVQTAGLMMLSRRVLYNLEENGRHIIQAALRYSAGNVSDTARKLGPGKSSKPTSGSR
jgi:hypothetical protein